MHATRNQKSLEYDKKVRKARRRRNLLGILACIVALCTMYSLMLPAITMECDTVCGLDEHVHTPDCYALPERVLHCTASAHVHNAECYDEGGNLICGVSDYLIHTHDAACYDEAGNLWCTLPEHPQHTHGESCYDESGALICLYTSAEAHQHSQACFVQSSPALICGIQEHQHSEVCYPQVLTQTAEICEQSMSDLMETEEDQAGAMTDQTETGSDQVETVSDQTETGQDQTETAPDQTETGPDQTEIAPDRTEFAQEQLAPQTFGLLPEVSLLGETAPGDFTGAITGVTYSGLEYNPNTGEHTANLSLEFKDIDRTDILNANCTFTYALPNGIIIPDSILGRSFNGYDAGNNKGFTFQFEKNEDGTYRVDIFFIKSYVEDGGDTFSGKMTFDVVFGESAYAEDGGIEIDFNENVKLDIPPEEMGYSENETKDYDLTLTKNGSYNPGTGKIVYTVTVVSKKGTPGSINLTDVLTANGLEIQDVRVTSVQLQDFTNSWGGLGEATAVTGYTEKFDQTTSTLTMILPQLTAGSSGYGQKYAITYEVDVADPGSAVYSPKNTVTGTSEKEGGSEITYTVDKTVTVKKTPPTKTGSYDAANGKVDWTITINAEQANIAGATLEDTMFAGLTASDIVLTPSSGYELVTSSDGKIESIKFLATESGENHQKYTITYSTPQETSWTETTVKNDATYTPPDGPPTTVSSTVTCKSTPPAKSGTYDPEKDVITWTITVNQDQANIVGYELTDIMLAGLSAEEIHIQPSDIGYQVKTDEQGRITKIVFKEAAGGTGENKNTYTITYTTQQDSVWGTVNVKNTVSYGTGDEKTEVTATVPVTGGSVEKTHTTAPVGSDGSMEITWTTSFTIPGAGLPIGSTITDTLVNPGSTHYMTATQIQALKTELDSELGSVSYTLQVSSDGTNWANYEENITGNFVAYKVTLTEGLAAATFGGQKLEFTYGSTADISSVLTAKDYVNKVSVLTPDGDSLEDQDKHTHTGTSGVEKTAESTQLQGNLKEITWKTAITLESGVLAKDMVITDTIQNPGTTHYMTAQQVSDLQETLNKILGSGKYELTLSSDGQNFAEAAENVIAYKITMLADIPLTENTIAYTYQTTADVSAVTTSKTFTNKVEVENPQGDKVSDEASYTHTCRVFKYDGSFKPGESSVTTEDGVLTWKVKVELDKTYTEVNITDTLPEGVSLTKLEYSTNQWYTDGGVYTVDSASWSSNNKNAAVTVEGQTVKTTFQNISGTLWLTYTCQLGEAQLNQSTTTNIGKLKNQVDVTTEEGELGSSEQTQEVTVEKPSEDLKYVDKSASYSKSNATIHYSVLINKDAVDYLPEKDTIHFTDILSYQFEYINYPMEVTLIPNSVKLYKAVVGEDGSYTKGDAVDFAWTLKETPITSQSCTVTSTLEGDVPDGTALILEYDYFVKVRNGYTASNQNPIGFNVSNTAKLEGETERKDTLDNHISWEKPAAGGSISTEKTYTIYKVEEGDYSKPLDGAVFTLYKYDADQKDFVPAGKTYTTANGMIQISWQNDLDTFWFGENTAYYIVETQAPEGYMLPAEPTKYYFYFSDDDTTANPEAYPSDWDTSSEYENKADLVANNRTIYCENTSSTTDLTVRKAWVNSSGESIAAPANSISFDLYQVVSHTPPSDSTEPEMVNLTVKGGGHNANPNYGYNNTPVQKGSILTLVIAYKDSISNPNPTVTANSTLLTPTIDGKTYTYTLKVSADTEVVARYNSNDGDATITVTVESPPVAETTEECYGSYTLTAEQGWKTVLTNLPRTGVDESGATVYYSYYVKETTEGYTVTYSNGNNPVVGGAITITNTTDQTATALTVQKLWKKADGTEMDSPTYTAEIQLYQRTGSGEISSVGSPVQLNSENNWTYQWANLPAADDTGETLSYYVEETAVTDGSGADITGKFNVTYPPNEATNNGEITVTNTVSITVQLPETGGSGDGIYQVLGWLLLSLATAVLMDKTRRAWQKGEGGAA